MDQEWTLTDFDYELPEQQIAQEAVEPRDHARLMVLDREQRSIHHSRFDELPGFLNAGDCLVLNDTRVLHARLEAHRDPTGGRVELLLLHETAPQTWEALAKPGRSARPGQRLTLRHGEVGAEVVSMKESGERIIRFDEDTDVYELMQQEGQLPLPPYIHTELEDEEQYQTVFGHREGSAAAPTAGLHFTDRLIEELNRQGIRVAYITLHVGVGTFRPVRTDRIAEHEMHAEYYSLRQKAANTINNCVDEQKRVIAVGTTVTRTLETCAAAEGGVEPGSGWTELFIRPGYNYNIVEALITNFHLPKSTLLMLVAAFAGYEFMCTAYSTAIEEGYRFYSLGDAMLIL